MTWDSQLQKFDAIVDCCPRFARKGKSMIYTSANGYMFGLLNKAGEIGFRFSKEVQEKYIKELHTTVYLSHGATMKGNVLIPQPVLDDLDAAAALLNESYDYVMSLEPK
jgi:hypothetical protein